MANLKDLIVSGSSRFIADVFADNIKANKFVTNGGTSSQFVKGDGTLDSNVYITAAQVSDDKVKQEATATGTDKYPLLLKYTTTYNATDNGNYTRFSSVASNSASILSATPAGDMYSKSLTTTAAISAGSTITAATSITATNGDISCTGSGKYFKGLLAPNATAASAYIYTSANQPLTSTSFRSADDRPPTVKNVVDYVTASIGDLSNTYLPLAGGTMSGSITMGDGTTSYPIDMASGPDSYITGLRDGVDPTDAATVGQSLVKSSYSNETYFDAEGLNIRRVATPVQNTDAVNKAYVDSRISNPTFATQDVLYNQLDGTKDFNIATVSVPSGQQQNSTNYYLNYTTKMSAGTMSHLMIHSSVDSGDSSLPYPDNYSTNSVQVKIPANIRVWDATAEGATSGDMEGVWVNGEQVLWCDVSMNSNFSDRGKSFTIPSNGFVEVSVLYVKEECQIKKGDEVTSIMVYRTLIKVDAPVASYYPVN